MPSPWALPVVPSIEDAMPRTNNVPIADSASAATFTGVNSSRKKTRASRVTRIGYVYNRSPVAEAEMRSAAVKYEKDWPT